jgi:acetyl-CoA carboxylase biotin carboxyl carrier protein
MLTQDDLDRLIDAMGRTGVTFLDIEGEDIRLRLALAPTLATAANPAPPAARLEQVRSPGIGTFAPRGSDDGLPSLSPGGTVSKGEVLGYLARGAVRLPITAPAAGILGSELCDAGTLLGHGDPVFELETST